MVALTHERATELIAEADAKERGEILRGILGNIEQTFDGQYLYETVEVRAAMLLYLIVKDHALLDGTKRGAETLFQEYLKINEIKPVGTQEFGRLVREVEGGDSTAEHKQKMTAKIVEAIQNSNL